VAINSVIKMDKKWLIGFIEGRGSFAISLQKHGGKNNYYPRPSFVLNSFFADLDIFEEIRRMFLDAGIKVYPIYHQIRSVEFEAKGLGRIRLEVKGLGNCLRLYEFLKREKWHTMKFSIFKEWGKCLNQMKKGHHLDRDKYPDFINNVLALNPKTSTSRAMTFLEKWYKDE